MLKLIGARFTGTLNRSAILQCTVRIDGEYRVKGFYFPILELASTPEGDYLVPAWLIANRQRRYQGQFGKPLEFVAQEVEN